jgi:hypothetical protein
MITGFIVSVIKAIDNNKKRKKIIQEFNVENPLQQREVKIMGAS